MRTSFALLLVVYATAATALAGQWSLAPEVGLTAFSGTGRDSAGLRVGPTRSTALALRLGWASPRVGVGLRVMTGSTGFGASDGDLTVIQEHQLRLVEVAGLVSWRVARVGTASRLVLEAGPALDIWSPEQSSTRSRVGAVAALVWAFPVTPAARGRRAARGGAHRLVARPGRPAAGRRAAAHLAARGVVRALAAVVSAN